MSDEIATALYETLQEGQLHAKDTVVDGLNNVASALSRIADSLDAIAVVMAERGPK